MATAGVDLLLRVRDLASSGLDVFTRRVQGLRGAAKDAAQDAEGLGKIFTAFRGGAAVAGLTIMAQGLRQSAEAARDLAADLGQVNRSSTEVTRGILETIPILGQFVSAGAAAGDAFLEMATGQAAAARGSASVDRGIAETTTRLDAQLVAQRRLIEAQRERARATAEGQELATRLLGRGDVSEERVRLEVQAEQELAAARRRHEQELEGLLSQRADALLDVLRVTDDAAASTEQFNAITAKLADELRAAQGEELSGIRGRLAAERELLDLREGGARLDRERDAAQERTERERRKDLEDRRRALGSSLEQAQARLDRAEAAAAVAGRTPAAVDARTVNPAALAFREQARAGAESLVARERRQVDELRRQSQLLAEIARNTSAGAPVVEL